MAQDTQLDLSSRMAQELLERLRRITRAGDCLVVVSDGVIERRSQDIGAGLRRLRDTIGRCRSDDPSTLAERVMEDLYHDRKDDCCILVVKRVP